MANNIRAVSPSLFSFPLSLSLSAGVSPRFPPPLSRVSSPTSFCLAPRHSPPPPLSHFGVLPRVRADLNSGSAGSRTPFRTTSPSRHIQERDIRGRAGFSSFSYSSRATRGRKCGTKVAFLRGERGTSGGGGGGGGFCPTRRQKGRNTRPSERAPCTL